MWHGQSLKALTAMVTPAFAPWTVLFIGPDHSIEKYRQWIDAHSFPLTVVAEAGGTVTYDNFNVETLRKSFINICDALQGFVRLDDIKVAQSLLSKWKMQPERSIGYQLGGHNSIHPNVLALNSAGYTGLIYGLFKNIDHGIEPYVEQICKTTESILNERRIVGERNANQYIRRPPGLNLFAPAIYPHVREIPLNGSMTGEDKRRLIGVRNALERQEGYTFEAKTSAQANAFLGIDSEGNHRPHFLMQERAGELRLATECIGTLAASEISAVIRLPNRVNRSAGQVRQFAQQYHSKNNTDRKRIELFRKTQESITNSIPQDFYRFIDDSEDGIRLVCDSHLEWADIRGLPLCLQKDTIRIPVTPGNLFIDQISPKPYEHLRVSDFSEILILSALASKDPISQLFDIALSTFRPHFADKIKIRAVQVRNKKDFIDALNSFDAAMLIFDGHGGHEPGKAATLQLLDEEINIWTLQAERPRVPPIVILSACDTHAADRNHASTANGFLSIGARTVLGSVFPIDARDASAFVARLLFRVAAFVPSAHKMFNRSLSWMEIMGGMIRMQLLTDFCRRLERKGIIEEDGYKAIHVAGNLAINSGDKWPFETVISKASERGIDRRVLIRELRAATANSTAISYLQLGRPETIIVHPDNGFDSEGGSEIADSLEI